MADPITYWRSYPYTKSAPFQIGVASLVSELRQTRCLQSRFTGVSGRLEGDVTYFCFIESSILSVPHMEPLAADDAHTAKIEAEALLKQHGSGYAAHVFEGNQRVGTVRRNVDAADHALNPMVRA